MTHAARPPLPYGRRSPAWLHRRLVAVFGAKITGLWIGEDIACDGSGNVTSWPGRIGPTLAVFAGGGTLKRTTFNGRIAAVSSGSNRHLFDGTLSPLKSHWSVSNSQSTVAAWARWGDTYPIDGGDCQLSVSGINMYTLYEGGAWRHYVNGAFTNLLPAGSAKFVTEGYNGANTRPGIALFGAATMGWVQPIAFSMALQNLASAGERSDGLPIIREYYNWSA